MRESASGANGGLMGCHCVFASEGRNPLHVNQESPSIPTSFCLWFLLLWKLLGSITLDLLKERLEMMENMPLPSPPPQLELPHGQWRVLNWQTRSVLLNEKRPSISNWQVLLYLWGQSYHELTWDLGWKDVPGLHLDSVICEVLCLNMMLLLRCPPKFPIGQGWSGLPRCFFWHVSGCCCFSPSACQSVGSFLWYYAE